MMWTESMWLRYILNALMNIRFPQNAEIFLIIWEAVSFMALVKFQACKYVYLQELQFVSVCWSLFGWTQSHSAGHPYGKHSGIITRGPEMFVRDFIAGCRKLATKLGHNLGCRGKKIVGLDRDW